MKLQEFEKDVLNEIEQEKINSWKAELRRVIIEIEQGEKIIAKLKERYDALLLKDTTDVEYMHGSPETITGFKNYVDGRIGN